MYKKVLSVKKSGHSFVVWINEKGQPTVCCDKHTFVNGYPYKNERKFDFNDFEFRFYLPIFLDGLKITGFQLEYKEYKKLDDEIREQKRIWSEQIAERHRQEEMERKERLNKLKFLDDKVINVRYSTLFSDSDSEGYFECYHLPDKIKNMFDSIDLKDVEKYVKTSDSVDFYIELTVGQLKVAYKARLDKQK